MLLIDWGLHEGRIDVYQNFAAIQQLLRTYKNYISLKHAYIRANKKEKFKRIKSLNFIGKEFVFMSFDIFEQSVDVFTEQVFAFLMQNQCLEEGGINNDVEEIIKSGIKTAILELHK
ncbi:hypothetical protein [Endozoicomonas sp. Mp262]|uniref:hypothetical protein n=1 Tax=Endozoicomonas sp. Mp262 TaxID=2919499 RepID=UPI0021DB67F5